MNLIKVSGTSRTSAVAGAIAGIVREHHRAEVQPAISNWMASM
jgi:stage V sporulation protein S